MSDDDVLLLYDSELETFEQSNFSPGSSHYTPVYTRRLEKKTVETTYISPKDKAKLTSLLDSKLLLPEDFEIVNFLFSTTTTSKRQAKYLWLYCGSLIAGTVSLSLLCSKQIGFLLPAALVSTLSFMSVRHCYDYLLGVYENTSFSSAVGCLQSLCWNVSKLLRLLKETGILSTGQVTTHNVGAALYIPVKSLTEQKSLPTWKTLPHIRRFLANHLLDVIDLLKSTGAEARKIVPNWLHIESYILSDETSSFIAERLRNTTNDISLKDLQMLNESYLILQSELLRWIGICICPSAWSTSDPNYKTNRIQIIKLFCSVSSQLSAISFELRDQHNIKNLFIKGRPEHLSNIKVKEMSIELADINYAQSELHNLYLLILSMLINLKSLEDLLEININSVPNYSGFKNLRKTINDQMKNIRNELRLTVDTFDTLCFHSFQKQKLAHIWADKLAEVYLDNTNSSFLRTTSEKSNRKSDCCINSLDEVFLALSDFAHNEQEKEDWAVESKPPIPNTLLAELSTSLKPIKENFKVREKAALKRAGLEDIDDESNESDATDKNFFINSLSSKSLTEIKKKRIAQLKRIKSLPLSNDSEGTEGKNLMPNKAVLKEDLNTSSTVLNDKSIASMIALKSQKWGIAEEEYYSDS